MTPDFSSIIGLAGLIITGIFTYLGVKAKAKSDRDVATAPDWDGFTKAIQEWTKEQLAERDEEIRLLRQEVNGLRVIERRYGIALFHISQVHTMNPGIQPEVPFEIKQDLK